MRSWIGRHPTAFSVIGAALAIASTTLLDAIGFGINVALLIPLFFLLWYLQRLSRVEIGIVWGPWRDYAVAILYPLVVIALVVLIASLSGAVALGKADWSKALGTFLTELLVSIPLAIVTEEGIFRGWLWASLLRAGVAPLSVLVWTSAAFAAWHISTALLPTAFRPPLVQVPVYIVNAGVIGFVWAQMRRRSGSIVVTSVSHSLWNALAYSLFGTGTTLGVLGIKNTAVFGPELGFVGLGLNLLFAVGLWLLNGRGDAAPTIDRRAPA